MFRGSGDNNPMKSVTRSCLSVAFPAFFLLATGGQAQCQSLSVSVRALPVTTAERIAGFEIHVRSGRIAQLPNVPIGWTITVDNDPSWDTVIRGSIAVGAAAENADFLRHFMVVEAEKDADGKTHLELRGEVIVTSDFRTEKQIKLLPSDFVATETRRGAAANAQ